MEDSQQQGVSANDNSTVEDKRSKWRNPSRRFTFSDIATNAFEPGINKSVLLFINAVFLILLFVLVMIIQFSTGYKLYMVGLVTLAFALFIAFNWFVAGIDKAEAERAAQREKDK